MGVQEAIRKNIKGRPRGGMVMGIRKELIEKGTKIKEVMEGMMEGRVRCGKERWRVIGMYVNGDIEKKLEGLERGVEEREGARRTIIWGGL